MCDTIDGELLVSFHQDDPAATDLMNQIREQRISHVTIIESLDQRLHQTELPMRETEYKFYRLGVPPGDEKYKIGYLQFFYKHAFVEALMSRRLTLDDDFAKWSNYHLQVVPHMLLSVRQAPPAPGIGFTSTPTHDDYKKLCGFTARPTPRSPGVSFTTIPAAPAPGVKKRVMVLDTGLDPASSAKVASRLNFVDYEKRNDVTDDNGHGTAVTEIIRDLCPTAEFIIYKVADDQGRASEWDTLAALAVKTDAEVANISLAFGLEGGTCRFCGRESHSSRSAVFENLVRQLDKAGDGPLIVAAAGNESLPELSFPARYENVLAIESMNKARELSQFSNRATIDQDGNNHQNVFVLPGGEKPTGGPNPTEYVGTSSSGDEYFGTSFAAAYASGLIAALWSQPAHSADNRQVLLDHLRNNTDKSLPNYNATTHGNGLMQFK